VTRLAAKGNWLYLTVGEKDALMKGLLAGETWADRVDAGKLARSLAPLGGKVSDVVLLSLPDYMMWAMSMTPLFSSTAPVFSTVAPSSQYTGMAVTFEQGKATARINVPMEEVLATKSAFEQMMKQQRVEYMKAPEASTESTLESPEPAADSEVEEPGEENEKQDNGDAAKNEAGASEPAAATAAK